MEWGSLLVVLASGKHWTLFLLVNTQEWYDISGQVTSGVRRWSSDNAIVAGQDYSYLFDDIGNRTKVGRGVPAAPSSYIANLLNQYTQHTVPGIVEVMGSAATNATVTVNTVATVRHVYPAGGGGEYFYANLGVSNQTSAVWTQVTATAVLKNGGTNGTDIVSQEGGKKFVARTPEQFSYDLDGNCRGAIKPSACALNLPHLCGKPSSLCAEPSVCALKFPG